MGLMEGFNKIIGRNQNIAEMLDFDLISETAKRTYLKSMALDSVLDFVSRTMSTLQVKTFKNGKKQKSEWDYILNVRPNKDLSAVAFWQKFFYRLLDDNEVLVIVTDDNQLLIAEDFTRNEYAVYEDTFSDVLVKNYTFERTFKMSEVIYLEYNNSDLESFTNGLFKDYSELFSRLVEVSMRNNQIRGSVSIEQTGKFDSETQTKLQKFIDQVYNSFKNNSVAIVPRLKGFNYEEYTNKQGVSNQSMEELDKVKKSLINDVSRAIGLPSALVHGEMADLKYNLEAYRKLCIYQLVEKLRAELTNKILSKADYESGTTLEVQNVLKKDPFELAVQIDKVISSGFVTPNEARRMFELETSDNKLMDNHYITKNYEQAAEGGET